MEIIGSRVTSRFTGKEGEITAVLGSRLKVSFCNGGEIVVDIDSLNMDSELEDEIKKLMCSTRTKKAKTAKKAPKQKGNYTGGRIREISTTDDISFDYAYDVINSCFGKEYRNYQRASWSLNNTFRVWMPKLIPDMTYPAAANDCKNILSADGTTLTFVDERNEPCITADAEEKVLIFAKDYNGPYRFRGVFVYDKADSEPRKFIYRKIADTAEFVDNPVSDIRIY